MNSGRGIFLDALMMLSCILVHQLVGSLASFRLVAC